MVDGPAPVRDAFLLPNSATQMKTGSPNARSSLNQEQRPLPDGTGGCLWFNEPV